MSFLSAIQEARDHLQYASRALETAGDLAYHIGDDPVLRDKCERVR